MSKKRRTKIEKITARAKPVKSQFDFYFEPNSIKAEKKKEIENSAQIRQYSQIKEDITKSLFIASLILASIVVLYWLV